MRFRVIFTIVLANTYPECALPAFEGLVHSSHNEMIMDLLFIMVLWHGFAKMRIHTQTTVDVLRALTSELGRLLRQFKSKVCSAYETEETAAEHARRLRRTNKKIKQGEQIDPMVGSRRGRTVKKAFNLSTYKLHALGHYVDTIIRFGSTTSYSSQTVNF